MVWQFRPSSGCGVFTRQFDRCDQLVSHDTVCAGMKGGKGVLIRTSYDPKNSEILDKYSITIDI